jgi:hypothetical protein
VYQNVAMHLLKAWGSCPKTSSAFALVPTAPTAPLRHNIDPHGPTGYDSQTAMMAGPRLPTPQMA